MIFFLLKKSFDASEVTELLYFEVPYLELLPFSSFFPSVVFQFSLQFFYCHCLGNIFDHLLPGCLVLKLCIEKPRKHSRELTGIDCQEMLKNVEGNTATSVGNHTKY